MKYGTWAKDERCLLVKSHFTAATQAAVISRWTSLTTNQVQRIVTRVITNPVICGRRHRGTIVGKQHWKCKTKKFQVNHRIQIMPNGIRIYRIRGWTDERSMTRPTKTEKKKITRNESQHTNNTPYVWGCSITAMLRVASTVTTFQALTPNTGIALLLAA